MQSHGTSESGKTRSVSNARLAARLDGRQTRETRDDYFARGRARWLRQCLDDLGERPSSMVAFGWDRGSTSSEFFANLRIRSLVTVDVGTERHGGELRSADGRATCIHVAEFRATESADLAFTNGVFEHMTSTDRAAAAVLMFRTLKSGGLFSVWQNNPWSPRSLLDALTTDKESWAARVTPSTTRRLLRGVGFDIVHTTSALFFPPRLAWAQGLEPFLAQLPLGAQYMVLARKP